MGKVDDVRGALVFKFDEYSWYRNCLDFIEEKCGKSGVVGDEVLGADGKWTIKIDAVQVWVLRPNSMGEIIPVIEYYEGVKQ